MWSFIFRYEWIHFWRNHLQISLVSMLVVFGSMAIYAGNRQIKAQRTAFLKVQERWQTEWADYQAAFGSDTTVPAHKQAWQLAADPAFAWWRQGYIAQLGESALAPLAIGQRDLSPAFYRLTGMSLYYQLFQTELANPQKLLVGNFDLSFVLIYLLPLLIIALSFSLLSGDKEAGILPLVHVQAASVRRVLLGKLVFVFSLVTGLIVGLSLVGFWASDVNWSQDIGSLISWMVIVVAYCSFWVGLLWAIISFNQSSAVNALVGVGCWLLFLIVIPSLLSACLAVAAPLDSSDLATLARRESIDNEQDERVMRAIIQQYRQVEPKLFALKDTTYQHNLGAKGYAAFTQLNDAKHREMVATYWRSIVDRHALASRFNALNPAVNAQELLTVSAQTDILKNLRFWQSLPAFHHQIIQFYYSRLFLNQFITASEFTHRPTYSPPTSASDGRIQLGLLQLLVSAGLLFGWGWFNVDRQLH